MQMNKYGEPELTPWQRGYVDAWNRSRLPAFVSNDGENAWPHGSTLWVEYRRGEDAAYRHGAPLLYQAQLARTIEDFYPTRSTPAGMGASLSAAQRR